MTQHMNSEMGWQCFTPDKTAISLDALLKIPWNHLKCGHLLIKIFSAATLNKASKQKEEVV